MQYRFEKEPKNYEDFASGRVLYNAPGATAFPVRLASEIYQRGKCYLQRKHPKEKYTIYDPCCGGAYLLTAIGFLHGRDVKQLIGSDVDAGILELAESNLSLLNIEGINRRIEQLQIMIRDFGKESHQQALKSAERLKQIIVERGEPISYRCFQADATQRRQNPLEVVDLVITDVPYGNIAEWSVRGEMQNPIESMLDHLLECLHPHSAVVLVADKKQKVHHPHFKPLERIKAGKRQVVILEPNI